MSLLEFLWPDGGGIVALVGGGGKTSMMMRVVEEASRNAPLPGIGPLLATTTTKIQRPSPIPAQIHVGPSPPVGIPGSGILWVDGPIADGTKWKAPPLSSLRRWAVDHPAARIIIEADGSAGRPLKAPGPKEPVVPDEVGTVVCVVGLSALGRPVDRDGVHRLEIFEGITGLKTGESITQESIIRLLTHPEGGFKGALPGMRRILVVNQADEAGDVEVGASLGRRAMEAVHGLETVAVTSFGQDGLIRLILSA